MKKKLLCIFCILGLFFFCLSSISVSADTSVTYKDWDDETHQLVEKTVDVADDHILNDGFGYLGTDNTSQVYFADHDVTSAFAWGEIHGDVTIIIGQNVTVTFARNYWVSGENRTVKICGVGDGSGKLVINSDYGKGFSVYENYLIIVNVSVVINGESGEDGDEDQLEMEREMRKEFAKDFADSMAEMEAEFSGETYEQAWNRLYNENYDEPTLYDVSYPAGDACIVKNLFLYENGCLELNGGIGTQYTKGGNGLVLDEGFLWVEGGKLVVNSGDNSFVPGQAEESTIIYTNSNINFVYGEMIFDSKGASKFANSSYSHQYNELCLNAKYYFGDSASNLNEVSIDKGTFFKQNYSAARITGDKPVYESSITVTEDETIELFKGDTYQISTPVIGSDDATNKQIRYYSSSNGGVASVNNTGFVTAKNVGEAVITITTMLGYFKPQTTTVTFNISEKPTSQVTSITLSDEDGFSLIGDEEFTLSAEIAPVEAQSEQLKWTASNENVKLEVSDDTYSCKVIGVTAGTATVTCKNCNHDISKSVEVTVLSDEVTDITLSVDSAEVENGDTYTIVTTITPDYLDNEYLTFTSSDETVATVDSNGVITAVSEGTAEITIKNADGSITKTFTITVKIAGITEIVVASEDVKVKPNGSTKINVTLTPSDANPEDLVWTSSNEKVATVDAEGNVTAISIGETTITVKNAEGSVSKQIKVTVDASLCDHTHKTALGNGDYLCSDCNKVITKDNNVMSLNDYIASLQADKDPTTCDHTHKTELEDDAYYCSDCNKVIDKNNQQYELNEYIATFNQAPEKKNKVGLLVFILILVFVIILIGLFALLYFFSSFKNKNILDKPFGLCDKLFKKNKQEEAEEVKQE